MRSVSQAYREAIQQHRERGYRDSAYTRITIGNVVFGSEDIFSMQHTRASHPLSLSLPVANLSFVLNNTDGRFNVGSGSEILSALHTDAAVKLEYGLDVSGKRDIEWFVGGYFYLESWNVKGNKANLAAISIFEKLSRTVYKKGVFDKEMHTVYDLAVAVLKDAGVTNYRLTGNHLTETRTYMPPPYASHAECLQLLANLASSTLEVDPDGAIVMRQREEIDPEEYEISVVSGTPNPAMLPGSDPKSLVRETDKYNYATWEQNYFALDGKMRLYPSVADGATYLEVGIDLFNLPWENPEGIQYQNFGVFIDLFRERTFGAIEVEFPEYARVTSARITVFTSTYEPVIDRVYQVEGAILSVSELFSDVRYVHVYPLKTEELHRGRIRNIRIDNAVWPMLTDADALDSTNIKELPQCQQVSVLRRGIAYHKTKQEELMRRRIPPGELIEIKHPEVYYNLAFSSETAGVRFDVAEHYAYTSFVKISGVSSETEIILNGAKIVDTLEQNMVRDISPNGEVALIENPLSTITRYANIAADLAAQYYENRTEFRVTTLGYPESDANDQIRFNGKRAVILENSISINQGSMRGTIVARGE